MSEKQLVETLEFLQDWHVVKVQQRKPAYRISFVYSEASLARGKQNLTAVYWKSNRSGGKKEKERLWKCGGGN